MFRVLTNSTHDLRELNKALEHAIEVPSISVADGMIVVVAKFDSENPKTKEFFKETEGQSSGSGLPNVTVFENESSVPKDY